MSGNHDRVFQNAGRKIRCSRIQKMLGSSQCTIHIVPKTRTLRHSHDICDLLSNPVLILHTIQDDDCRAKFLKYPTSFIMTNLPSENRDNDEQGS